MFTCVYRVLRNKQGDRILITGKESDLELLKDGWSIVFESPYWDVAFAHAMEIAEDEVIEWYYEEQTRRRRKRYFSTYSLF